MATRQDFKGVQLNIPVLIFRAARDKFAETDWAKQVGNTTWINSSDALISLPYNAMPQEVVSFFYEQLKASGERGLAGAITALQNATKDPSNSSVGNLKVLAKVMEEYIGQNAIDGWVYRRSNGSLQAYLVYSVNYTEASEDCPASVRVTLVSNKAAISRDGDRSERGANYSMDYMHFGAEDIAKRKIAEILGKSGYIKETKELKDEYSEQMLKFEKLQPLHNHQFLATGEVLSSDRYGSNMTLPAPVKVVNDEGLIQRRFTLKTNCPFWENVGRDFQDIPVHPLVYVFNLSTHSNMWVPVTSLEEYVYDKTLRDKLVMPADHQDLIEILTQDMDVLMDDIIAGKSGGTTILCKGGPGLGKTLTAEVYSEVIERPLYRVHSGQLGTDSAAVQQQLESILKRAERWGAVLLIDEADVYIRKRGDDIDHNAVVASFLRTLEYFHGLLFMTTNRSDDVDDAIVSRCIATISYQTPSYSDAVRIWKVLSTQFDVPLSDSLISGLAEHFDTASGRDIKELLKLAKKWITRKNVPPTLIVFKQCAQFRGLIAKG